MNQRCLKEFKVKYTEKENMGGHHLISIFSFRSRSEAWAVSLGENIAPSFTGRNNWGCRFIWGVQELFLSRKAIRNWRLGG